MRIERMSARRTVFLRFLLSVLVLGCSGAIGHASDPLAELDDEFDDSASLADWQRAHVVDSWPDQLHSIDIGSTAPGHLSFQPEVSGWYEDYRGVLLFKMLTSDHFEVTVRIESTGLDGTVSDANFSLAGVMIRAPRPSGESWTPGGENWLFMNTGANGGQSRIEVKNTTDSDSDLELFPTSVGSVELSIVREGALFSLYRRFDGEERELIRQYDRPDMPETVQVGIDGYTDWDSVVGLGGGPVNFNAMLIESPPGQRDLAASVDWIRFRSLGSTEPEFVRGDANDDGSVDISDPVRILTALFIGGVELSCAASADADDNGALQVTDAVRLLNLLFAGAESLSAPTPDCGADPTVDELGCEEFSSCPQ